MPCVPEISLLSENVNHLDSSGDSDIHAHDVSSSQVYYLEWISEPNNADNRIQVDLGDTYIINKVYTPGIRDGSNHYYVTHYSLITSVDGENWDGVKDDSGNIIIFKANVNKNQNRVNVLTPSLLTRFIRLTVV